MKRIGVTDFKYSRKYRYFSYKTPMFEVCLEPCLNGFDVAIYDKRKNLMEGKVCLEEMGYGNDLRGTMPRSKKTWEHALAVANSICFKNKKELGNFVMYQLKRKGGETYENTTHYF